MDDLTAVREFRAGAPEADRSRLAPGRQRLSDVMTQGRRTHRFRHDWRFAVAGATAAVVLAGVLGTQVVHNDGPSEPATVGAGTVTAASVLNAAADAALAAPAPHPGNGQWVYLKTAKTDRIGTGRLAPPVTHEEWQKYTDPAFDDDPTNGDSSPRTKYEFLTTLPADLGQVRAMALDFYPDVKATEPPDQAAFDVFMTLAASSPADPRGLSRVYRALAAVPGMKARPVVDVTGHKAVAVYPGTNLPGSTNRLELLLDARTYAYAGYQSVTTVEPKHPLRMGQMHKGQVDYAQVVVGRALVDRKGQRP